MGFGPSASGKTYWTKKIIELFDNVNNKETFPKSFLSIDGGIAREESIVYQFILNAVNQNLNIDGITNLSKKRIFHYLWPEKDTLFKSPKKRMVDYIKTIVDLTEQHISLYVPETLGGCFDRGEIWSEAAKIQGNICIDRILKPFLKITNDKNSWIGLLIYQHKCGNYVNLKENNCENKDVCRLPDYLKCKGTTESGKIRELMEGKKYSNKRYETSIKYGLVGVKRAPGRSIVIHNSGGRRYLNNMNPSILIEYLKKEEKGIFDTLSHSNELLKKHNILYFKEKQKRGWLNLVSHDTILKHVPHTAFNGLKNFYSNMNTKTKLDKIYGNNRQKIVSIIVSHNSRIRCLLKDIFKNEREIHRFKNCAILRFEVTPEKINVKLINEGVLDEEENNSKKEYYILKEIGEENKFKNTIKYKESNWKDLEADNLKIETHGNTYVFYIIRHGQATHNRNTGFKNIKSHLFKDTQLTETGIKQATGTGLKLKLKKQTFDFLDEFNSAKKLFVSDLKRTRQTLYHILKYNENFYQITNATLINGKSIYPLKPKHNFIILPCSHELAYKPQGNCDAISPNSMARENLSSVSNIQHDIKEKMYNMDISYYNKFYGYDKNGYRSNKIGYSKL